VLAVGVILLAAFLHALGAALCLVNTCCGIGFIVRVQLNYAIAPRTRFLAWIG
jgi:hypothetical protein